MHTLFFFVDFEDGETKGGGKIQLQQSNLICNTLFLSLLLHLFSAGFLNFLHKSQLCIFETLFSYHTSQITNITNFPNNQSTSRHGDRPVVHSAHVYRLNNTNNVTQNHFDSCSGRYIYVHNLPSQFIVDLVKKCHGLIKWTGMCLYLSNGGFGIKLEIDNNSKSVLMENGWYLTNQFSLEVIFP